MNNHLSLASTQSVWLVVFFFPFGKIQIGRGGRSEGVKKKKKKKKRISKTRNGFSVDPCKIT